MMKQLFISVSLLMLSAGISAQMTGSFSESVDFNEADYNFTRILYYYVPTDYDATKSYKLVVGFRGGPHSNAGQFRDQLSFLADSIDAIVLCPENNIHFNNNEGLTKQLFEYSVIRTMSNYNIDEDFIYLTGLSYGGRHAVIVAMDTDNGPLANLRGVIPFATGSNAQLEPNYDAVADFPPACICIGLNDNSNFQGVANSLHNDIQANGGVSFLNEIPNVGHTVAFPRYPVEMMECFNFIESQYNSTATKNTEIDKDVTIYPNPAHDFIDISFSGQFKPTRINVLNATGAIELAIETGNNRIDISRLKAGLKILQIISNGKTIIKPFMIVR